MTERKFDDPILGFEDPILGFEDPFFIEVYKKVRSMDRASVERALREIRIRPERFSEIFRTGKGSRDELDSIRRYRWP